MTYFCSLQTGKQKRLRHPELENVYFSCLKAIFSFLSFLSLTYSNYLREYRSFSREGKNRVKIKCWLSEKVLSPLLKVHPTWWLGRPSECQSQSGVEVGDIRGLTHTESLMLPVWGGRREPATSQGPTWHVVRRGLRGVCWPHLPTYTGLVAWAHLTHNSLGSTLSPLMFAPLIAAEFQKHFL